MWEEFICPSSIKDHFLKSIKTFKTGYAPVINDYITNIKRSAKNDKKPSQNNCDLPMCVMSCEDPNCQGRRYHRHNSRRNEKNTIFISKHRRESNTNTKLQLQVKRAYHCSYSHTCTRINFICVKRGNLAGNENNGHPVRTRHSRDNVGKNIYIRTPGTPVALAFRVGIGKVCNVTNI